MGKLLSIIVNDNHMRIAELSSGSRGVAVSRLFTKEVPENLIQEGTIRDVRAFSDYLVTTLRYANIKTRHVVFSLPADKIMTREVVLPELSEEKLYTTLKANASEYFPIDLSEYVLSYFPISKIEKDIEEESADSDKKPKAKNKKKSKKKIETQLRLMVLAAPNEMVQSYYDVVRLAHLKLDALDYIGNSVIQLTTFQVEEEPCLVIQLDNSNTVLTVYDNNVMVLQRYVDFGAATVVSAVMEEDHSDYETAEKKLETEELIHKDFEDEDQVTESLYSLIGNVKHIIEYYTGRNVEKPLEQVYVMGEGSLMSGLAQLLDNQLNLPVETITALKQVYIKNGTGLSMKEILKYMDNIGAVIAPVNFLPKQLEQDMRRKLESKAYRIMILLALFIAVIIITIPTGRFFTTAMETLDLKNKLLVTEDAKPILDNYQQAELRYEDVKKVQAFARTNNQSLLDFIAIFEQLRPSNVSLTDFSCNEGEVSFSALASGKETVAKLILQLNTIANISDVVVSGLSSSFEGEQETVSFSVTCKLASEDTALLGGISNHDAAIADGVASDINDAVEPTADAGNEVTTP